MHAFHLFHTFVKTQFETEIKELQTDWSGEYRPFTAILPNMGVHHRLTCPHTSEQNGVVERKHRHVIESTLVLMAQDSLPLRFWSYVVSTSVYLINRMPTKVLDGKSPFEALYNKLPDYSGVRVFGCRCFPHLRMFQQHKLDFRSQPCTFLGYSAHHKGYQCLAPSGKIFISRHVVFDESCFPFAGSSDKTTKTGQMSPRKLTHIKDAHRVCARADDYMNIGENHIHVPSPRNNSVRDSELMNQSAGDGNVNSARHDTVDSDIEGAGIEQYAHDENVAVDEQQGLTQSDSEDVVSSKVAPSHHMITRSKRGIFKPKVYLSMQDGEEEEPHSIQDALQSDKWKAAVQEEYDALVRNNTWTLEEVYMQQPQGFEEVESDRTPLVCKLNRALYGLRQAPRNWYVKLKEHLVHIGFEVSLADCSLFVMRREKFVVYVLVYVDDIIVTGNSVCKVEEVVSLLGEKYSLKDLGQLNFFLGIEVKYVGDSIFLSQKKYIMELLGRVQMSKATLMPTPMVSSLKLTKEAGSPLVDPKEYRSLVGSLLYACHTRPDIAYSVNKLAQFMHAPCEQHLSAVKRVLRYLNGTLDHGLVLSRNDSPLQITAFADADWAGSMDDRRSISGNYLYLAGNLIVWSSKKQKTISRSTTKAEYKSLADVSSDATWVAALLDSMGIELQGTPVIWCDNSSAISMSANLIYHAKTKHVELDVHFVRENVATNKLKVNYVPSSHQVADGFTKALSKDYFNVFRQRLGVVSLKEVEDGRSMEHIGWTTS
ncbi:hypothetical protein F3Y22_tig00110209pilonHSYRG00092 [Hibiscus syriacus]|uniref:Integrase catalytic domain-containing protein n=1 Tax=Hibiscus syriacus TaxID=106335 RepID=A0A6A3BFF5_HIBSY|nr:hypothetical protein F3Y22_tig00110209pilonHSYRG00092 [Hibiscus syriacus]